jgi:predicted glycosyltransferase
MNREAVVLGTPVYSIFAGRLGGVDRALIDSGRMVLLESSDDLATIRVEKKAESQTRFAYGLRALLIEKCLEVADAGCSKRQDHRGG